jgi:hypothetical protein
MGEGRRENSRARAASVHAPAVRRLRDYRRSAPRYMLAGSIVLALLAVTPAPAQAQFDVTVHGDVSLTATETSFLNGYHDSYNNTITYSASGLWVIYVCSLDADLGQSDDGFYTKPLSDLEWKRSSQSSWNAMTTSDALVRGGPAGASSFDMDYRFLLSWSQDSAGAYGATIQYTITAL